MKNKENTLGANKQMAFLNTTKLAVLSAMLLLAVFCTIGMSFTPAEEGENVGNPNDSTYVTGPRRGHWGSGCDTHNKTDYAIATAITKGYGTVTISSGSKTETSSDTPGAEVSITWECTGKDDPHSPTFTFSATPSNGYKFDGWSTDGNTIIPSQGNPFEETITMSGYNTDNASYESPTNTHAKLKYYAHFSEKRTATITFGIPINGKYTYKLTDAEGDGEEVSSLTTPCPTLETEDEITLTATPGEGHKFFGWYKGTDSPENYLSYNVEFKKTFSEDITIYAKFISENTAIWLIKETKKHYDDLSKAIDACGAEKRTIVLISDGVVPAGNCTIPSNVTLLIPYDEAYEVNETSPTTVTADASPKDPSLYRKLTLEGGVNIVVEGGGSICVNAKILSGNTTAKNVCGRVTGGYGLINMMSGSSITLSSGAKLYCWGYIIGEGTIEAESEAHVYEPFQLADFRGGSASTSFLDAEKCNKVFPYSQYYVQNIEVPLTLQAGAKETLFSGFIVTNPLTKETIETTFSPKFVGSDGLFNITEGTFTKYYDKDEDRLVCTVNGTLVMQQIEISITTPLTSGTNKISSEKYVLPITNNLTININSGTTTVSAEAAFLAGTRTYIAEGATLQLTRPTYIYDRDNWVSGQYVYGGSGEQLYFKPLHYSGSKGTSIKTKRKDNDLLDAVIDVNGTFIANDFLYTTAGTGTEPNLGGADICSSEGTGVIQLTKGAGTATETYQATQPSEIKFIGIPITAAQLHNGEEWYKDKADELKKEYLATAGVASTTIQYANNHWGWMEIWKDADGTILKINNTCTQVNKSSANPLDDLTNFVGWSTEVNETNQEVIHTAHYTTHNSCGTPLDIVDADGTNLTINANGWASSGWPYTINGTEYGKDDKAGKEKYRQADRTLVIPYGDKAPNKEIVIEVKDKDGTVVSCNKYIVPFVYTSDATLSDTDENRIVFVKSGTLSIEGTASAKEIYVAPGAALQVNENGTLNVEKLVLRTTPFDAAILTNNGTIAGQVYYSRISPDSEQYYQFGLPLSCPLANVKMSNTDKLGGSQPKYGTAWMLKSYNEKKRANNGIKDDGANWTLLKNIDNTGVITAGVGYEMFSNSNYYREFYFPVDLTTATTQVSVKYTDGTIGAEHNGWNIITSPLTSRANVPIIDPATAFKVCWLQADGSYEQELPTVFPPAIPFSIQTSAEGKLNFAIPTIAAAPRKQSAAEALTETEWVHLDIFDAYGEGDETSLFVHPTRFEQIYKTGIDVAKQSLTAARPIIYSTHAYGDMAFAGIADSLLENGIDLAVYSPSAQELTFSLRENKFLHRLEYLWLADNETGERTDLLMDDYTCRANAGATKGRFVLNGRFKAPQISTGIGNTQTDYNIYAISNNIAISGVEQGTAIYVFDAVGHMIYTTSATSDEVIVPAPCAGVYMLTIGCQTAKLVVNK